MPTSYVQLKTLENLFSVVRGKGGFSDNPDVKQFANTYKQVLIKCCISQSELSNCESDSNTLLLDAFGTPSLESGEDEVKEACFPEPKDLPSLSNVVNTDVNSVPKQNALFYVAGYTCRKYLSKHDCEDCRAVMVCSQLDLLDPNSVFLKKKLTVACLPTSKA